MKNLEAIARWVGAGSLLFAVLAACFAVFAFRPATAQQTPPAPPAVQQDIKVRFTLDRPIDGTAAPLLLAIERGYFKAEGLEVTVDAAVNAFDGMTRLALANGAAEPTHDMSFGDINFLMRYRDQNPPTGIKAVFIVYDKPAYALIGRRSRGVQFPKDLEGKRLGAPGIDPAGSVWPLFARLNSVDVSKVTVMNVGPQVRAPMLAAGEVDAIAGNSFSAFVDLKDRSVQPEDIVVLLMADYGATLYGSAILASAKFQTEKPDAIRGFLRAYVKGVRDTAANPSAAIDIVLTRMQGARKEVELERLQIALTQNIKKFDPKDTAVGGVDPQRFAAGMEQLGTIYSFKNKLKAEDIFDAQYLPAPPPAAAPAPKQPQKKKGK